MAWNFDKDIIVDGPRRHAVKITGTGDGTGTDTETIAVDISTLDIEGRSVDRLRVNSIEYDTTVKLKVSWDATTNDEIANISSGSQGFLDWTPYGGRTDPQSAGSTGDILITPQGSAANDQFTVTLDCIKKPA